MSDNRRLHCPQGQFILERMPRQSDPSLRAWDAADELLLGTLHEQALLENQPRLLLLNDQFGALCCALHALAPCSWGDSYLAQTACTHNYRANQLAEAYLWLASTAQPSGHFDLVLIKIPKSLALLEHQLIGLQPLLHSDSRVIAAGMSRHIHSSTMALFEQYLGSTQSSRAVKKARLIFSRYDKGGYDQSPYPSRYYDSSLQLSLSNHANVFCRDKLDIGARFFIEQFAQLPAAGHIVDLGCGNGVLGMMAKKAQPRAQISFVDESYMAVASANENYRQLEPTAEHAAFYVNDGLQGLTLTDVDLVLCNPPFHQQHSIGDHLAWRMFKQSLAQLAPGGQLWVVANRHLGYHIKLKRLFGNCRSVAGNKKFVVLCATKG